MKYGLREICEVVLRAKAPQKIGNKIFYKNEPVIYFDSLKTSSLEGAATTVYAQGGRGNARLIAWEGERTLTYTMEDALISPEGFMILSGAGLIEATPEKPIYQHTFEYTDSIALAAGTEVFGDVTAEAGDVIVYLKQPAYLPLDKNDNFAYVMVRNDKDELITEPIIPVHWQKGKNIEHTPVEFDGEEKYPILIRKNVAADLYAAKVYEPNNGYTIDEATEATYLMDGADGKALKGDLVVLVDYYVEKKGGAKQIEITADKFGGNYYLEASTLFRNTDGVDEPAEFIIPNCKIQSNFTFTMGSTGDPSSFTFTMDAFPDYTRFDKTKKVLAALQIISTTGETGIERHATAHDEAHNKYFVD